MIGIYWWMYHGESSRYFVGCHTFNFLVVFSGVWRSFFSIFFGRLNGDILSDLSQTFSLYFFSARLSKFFFFGRLNGEFCLYFVWPFTNIFSILFSARLSILFRAFERWILSTFCLTSHRYFLYAFFLASLNIFSGVWTLIFFWPQTDICSIFFFRAPSRYFVGRLFCTYWPYVRIRIQEIHLTQWILLV